MGMVERLAALGLLIVLSGCQTAAQHEVAETREGLHQVIAELKACRESVMANPAYGPLAEHLPSLSGKEATLAQMSDPSFASSVDAKSLSDWYSEALNCRKQFSSGVSRVMPSYMAVYDRSWGESDSLYLDIAGRKITWGQAVVRAKGIAAETKAGLQQASETYDSRMEARHEQELAQRQAAAQAFAASMRQQQQLQQQQQQQQQLINSLNRPVQTNCNTFGSSTNCTTY